MLSTGLEHGKRRYLSSRLDTKYCCLSSSGYVHCRWQSCGMPRYIQALFWVKCHGHDILDRTKLGLMGPLITGWNCNLNRCWGGHWIAHCQWRLCTTESLRWTGKPAKSLRFSLLLHTCLILDRAPFIPLIFREHASKTYSITWSWCYVEKLRLKQLHWW